MTYGGGTVGGGGGGSDLTVGATSGSKTGGGGNSSFGGSSFFGGLFFLGSLYVGPGDFTGSGDFGVGDLIPGGKYCGQVWCKSIISIVSHKLIRLLRLFGCANKLLVMMNCKNLQDPTKAYKTQANLPFCFLLGSLNGLLGLLR